MAKIISYQFLSAGINHGTEEKTDIVQVISPVKIICKTQAQYDANYALAQKEAIPGTIVVTGEFEPVQDSTDAVLNALLGVTV